MPRRPAHRSAPTRLAHSTLPAGLGREAGAPRPLASLTRVPPAGAPRSLPSRAHPLPGRFRSRVRRAPTQLRTVPCSLQMADAQHRSASPPPAPARVGLGAAGSPAAFGRSHQSCRRLPEWSPPPRAHALRPRSRPPQASVPSPQAPSTHHPCTSAHLWGCPLPREPAARERLAPATVTGPSRRRLARARRPRASEEGGAAARAPLRAPHATIRTFACRC